MFPGLYLPIMEESLKRSLRPWRMWLPIPAWFTYRARMRQLNAYVKGRLRDRWHQRRRGWAPDQPDLVDHLMRSLEVNCS